MVKILIILSIAAFLSISSLGTADEMERWSYHPNSDPILPSLPKVDMDLGKQIGVVSQPINMDKTFEHRVSSFIGVNKNLPMTNNSFPKSSVEPNLSNRVWEDTSIRYMEQEIKKSIVNSVPDPSDIYVGRKFENDILRGLNTTISVATASAGNPLSLAGAAYNIIHNFGPQSGPVHDATGRIGDVLFVTNTGRNILSGNYSDAVIGVTNRAIGGTVDAQRKTLRDPIITSDLKHYQIKTNDGFTRVESVGSVGVTKTYTPPQAVRPFGPPDIFEGSTKITTKSNSFTRIETGNFNNSFNTNTYISPPFKNYQTPSLNNFNNYKPTTFKSPTFSPSFNTSGFNSFGRIR